MKQRSISYASHAWVTLQPRYATKRRLTCAGLYSVMYHKAEHFITVTVTERISDLNIACLRSCDMFYPSEHSMINMRTVKLVTVVVTRKGK
jgi:hypothetical protein